MHVEQLGVAGAGAQRRQAQHPACGRRARGCQRARPRAGGVGQDVRTPPSARSSRCSTSARSRSAVRARVAATPGPSSASSSGSTVRADPGAGEPRVVVVRVVPPADALGPAGRSVWARVTSSSGRRKTSNARRMPASDRPPQPRVSPSSTVSAWSSRVCPSSTTPAPKRSATSLEHGVPRLAGGRLGPVPVAVDRDPDRGGLVGAERGHLRRPRAVATSAEPSCRPWSTVTPTTGHGRLARLEDGGGQQGQRVGAARAGDQDRCGAGVADGERPPYGHPGGGDGGVGPGHHVDAASPTRRDRRSRPWWAGGRGPARRR